MILVTAHDGCEGTPSNTLDSVREGIASGADIIEVDVRATKDGIAVLSHSSTIKTVSGKTIPLSEMVFNDILKLEKDKEIRFEHPEGKITKLDDIIDLIKGSGIVINLDVKEDESIESIVKTINDQKMLDNVFISGCERIRASFFKHNYPEFQVLLNIGTDLSHLVLTDNISAAKTIYRYASLAGCCGINLPYQFCSSEIVEFMHKRFLPVSVWTVDKPEEMKKIAKMSVFSITTNRPRKLREILDGI